MRTKLYYYNLLMITLFLFILVACIFLVVSYIKHRNVLQVQEKIHFQTQYVEQLQNTVFQFYHQKQDHFKNDIVRMDEQYQQEIKSFDTISWFNIRFQAHPSAVGKAIQQELIKLGKNRNTLTVISKKIIDTYTLLGLDHNSGAYGKLRHQAHIMERSFKDLKNQELQIILLTLRRHEKDFMLRGLNKYVFLFLRTHSALQVYLKEHKFEEETVNIANMYRTYFKEFVQYSTTLGLSEEPGLTQSFYTTVSDYQKHVGVVEIELKQQLEINQHTLNILVSVIIGLLVCIVLIYAFYKSEIKAAQERNPLSGLNGNNRIQEYLKAIGKSKEQYCVIYFDFDYFKPFNDMFGFTQGDEVIHYFSKRLKFYFNKPRYFIGHIGGDDFVVIAKRLPLDAVQVLIETLQEDFKQFTQRYYTKEQLLSRCIQAKDRFGIKRALPLLEVSAAVLIVPKGYEYRSNQEITDTLADLKPLAKQEKRAFSSKI